MLSLLTGLNPAYYTYRSYVVGSGDEFSAGRAREFERGIAGRGEKKGEEEEEEEEVEEEEEDKEYKEEAEKENYNASFTTTRKGPKIEHPSTTKKKKKKKRNNNSAYTIHTVPRARQIHQPLLTSPLTSLRCLRACLTLLLRHPTGYPDLILTNGPATSLVLILASTILRYFSFLPFVSRAGRGGEGGMRVIYVESWARVKRPSLSGRIIVWCGLCDRVLVQWKGLQDRGWGEYKGVLVR